MLNVLTLCLVMLAQQCAVMKDTKEIEITGIAYNAKLGAIVESADEEVYFLEGVKAWDSAALEKKVVVTGILQEIEHKPVKEDPEKRKAHAGGDEAWVQKVIKQPKWRYAE